LKSRTVTTGLNADSSRVALFIGDDAAARLVGTADLGAGEFLLVEVTDLAHGIAALKIGRHGVDASNGDRGCSVFLYLGTGVELDVQLFYSFFGIVGAERAEGSIDLDVVALLGDVGALGNAVSDDADGGGTEHSDENDDADDDQDDFEGAAATLGGWWGGSDWLARGGRSAGHCSPTFATEFCPLGEGCSAGITECHGSPRGWLERASIPQMGGFRASTFEWAQDLKGEHGN